MLGDIKQLSCLELTPTLKKSKYLCFMLIIIRPFIPVQQLFDTLGQMKTEPIIQAIPPIYTSTLMAENRNKVAS